ncbi:MAG: beta-N-acetylhexosaminidase [Spirochaetes bacterium]|nr:beta-N-acetylhexosaminidase [Spirochaetota bacterium]
MKMHILFPALSLFSLMACSQYGTVAAPPDPLSIVPYPSSLEKHAGTMNCSDKLVILADPDRSVQKTAALLAGYIAGAGGPAVPVKAYTGARPEGAIILAIDRKAPAGEESYRLEVREDGVMLRAREPRGIFRGSQTLRQMLLAGQGTGKKGPSLPCITISDAPRFPWRGLNLDCSRHFYSKNDIKRYLDLMACYKMNVFHWNLVNDQGWRLEIKKYPKLTEVGAWRTEGGKRYGGFYTREDVREILDYARERFITVVPEIDMPGHSRAALAAYPEYSCTGGPFSVSTRWGIHTDIFCAGNDGTFRFLEDVLAETAALFPGTYIHVGGDECPPFKWHRCPRCQSRMKEQGLKDERELHGWFMRRIASYLETLGRKTIGWDEILEGGAPAGTTVQFWRGSDRAAEAIERGHRAIVSTTGYTYFDYGLAVTGLSKVYSFEPVPPGLPGDKEGMVLGSEANMWSEFATPENTDAKLFPRILALSEVLWTPKEKRNYDDFHRRMETQYVLLKGLGVRYGGESEPGFLKIGYFFRDLGILFRIIPDDPEVAWHTVKLYLGL